MSDPVNIEFIPEHTAKVFVEIGSHSFFNRFTLVGGTALSLQFGHRMSEDLDFIYAIAALKFSSIAQRNTFRDYYDLYFLAKHHFPLLELITFTKEHIPGLSPVTYSETLVYTKDIEEESIASHLAPKELVDKEQIAAFFSNELIRIKDLI